MTALIPCPSCQTMNRPEQERCRACGRRLNAPQAPNAPVGLKRGMGGEVFTAVLEDATRPAAHAPPSASVAHSPPPEAEDDVRRVLAEAAERLRQRASSTGNRFKPYSGDRARVPGKPEERKAVARQLESAALAFREKHYENAIEHLLKAISKDDRDPRSWALLGEAYLRCDRPYKGAVGYLQVLALEPRNAAGWTGLSRSLKAVGDNAGAVEVLETGRALVSPSGGPAAPTSDQTVPAPEPESAAVQDEPGKARSEEAAAPEAVPAESPPEEHEAPEGTVPEEELPDFDDLIELPAREAQAPEIAEAPKGHPARVPTYVEGLDGTMGGGIPWGHVVLIEGSPGTMKSSLGFSILLQNAVRGGMHGLYLSLEERTSSLLKQMGSLGLRLQVKHGSLVVLDPRAAKDLLGGRPDWVEAFRAAVAAIQAQRGLDLIVIDSLEALEVLAKFRDRRREIFRLFEWLRDLDITSFVVTERPDWVVGGHVIQGRWDEDFLADGVIHLRQHLVSDLEVQRRLRVVKLRGTRHDTGYMALVLDDGRFRVTRAMSP